MRVVMVADVGMMGRVGAEHMVGDKQIIELHRFRGLGIVADGRRVGADFGLGENGADLHCWHPILSSGRGNRLAGRCLRCLSG